MESVLLVNVPSLCSMLTVVGDSVLNSMMLKLMSSVQVFVLVNSDSGEFTVSLKPEDSLCDGNWHSILSKLQHHFTTFPNVYHSTQQLHQLQKLTLNCILISVTQKIL